MDARWLILSLCLLGFLVPDTIAAAAGPHARSENFVVIDAPSQEVAQRVSAAAEKYRRDLAIHWLGRELPKWPAPCTIQVQAGNRPAEGRTTYNCFPGHVGDFQMVVIGTEQRILDSVLPHEVTHTILSSHFGRPLPRWADEGISTTVEHNAERSKHEKKLREFLTTGRGIPMNQMFMMKEYPPEMLTLYAQGYSVCRFLIEQQGPREFISFLETYFARGSWTNAVQRHYQYESLAELQGYWLEWVRAGGGPVGQFARVPAPANTSVIAAVGNGAASDIGQILAASGQRSDDPASLGGKSTILAQSASPSSDGWYQRRRQEVASGQLVQQPDSINRVHSSAQPSVERGAIQPALGAASRWR